MNFQKGTKHWIETCRTYLKIAKTYMNEERVINAYLMKTMKTQKSIGFYVYHNN